MDDDLTKLERRLISTNTHMAYERYRRRGEQPMQDNDTELEKKLRLIAYNFSQKSVAKAADELQRLRAEVDKLLAAKATLVGALKLVRSKLALMSGAPLCDACRKDIASALAEENP